MKYLYLSDKDKSIFRYTPTYNTNISIYNASTFGARILSHIYRYTNNAELLEISQKVMDYILSKQKTNGAWYFSEMNGVERKQIDFHQGFILDALDDFISNTRSDEGKYLDALLKGVDFYKNGILFTHFFNTASGGGQASAAAVAINGTGTSSPLK